MEGLKLRAWERPAVNTGFRVNACQDGFSNDVRWRLGHQALLEVKGTSGKRELRALLTQNSMSRHGIRISVTFLFPALKRRKVPMHRGAVLLSLGEVSSLPRQT